MRLSSVSAVTNRLARRLALVASALVVATTTAGDVGAAPPSVDDVVGFIVEGTGNGHGRGLSQWGAYGWAVEYGWSWEEILDHYYGGTVPGSIPADSRIGVRLTDWDGTGWLGVVSKVGSARWSAPGTAVSDAYAAIRVQETSAGVFDISIGDGSQCPGTSSLTVPDGPVARSSSDSDAVRRIQTFLTAFGHDPQGIDGDFGPMTESAVRAFQLAQGLTVDGIWNTDDAERARQMIAATASDSGWTSVATGVTGPITLTTDAAESSSANGDVLGLCSSAGSLTHYRGALEFHDTTGGNRVVNRLLVEDYLRGVVPQEVSASWGDRGDGAGMNALRAQAVAARSYGVSQSRYSYAGTCDTSSCQVYAGAATRATVGATTVSTIERPQTDQAIRETAGVVRVWSDGNPTGQPAGGIVSTEFSASNGPTTAGGAFPSVSDDGDAVSLNPNHRWTRLISVESILSAYPSADIDRVMTVVDPDSDYVGIYANRVRVSDSSMVSAWTFRNAFNLPSPGFTLTPITRGVMSPSTMWFIGDSVGESITGTNYGRELPMLVGGAFASVGFDALSSRRTEGGSIEPDGVGAAALVPVGTELVVVELGYNDEASAMPERIDAVMETLIGRGVGTVAWVTMSERRVSGNVPRYAAANDAVREARGRWPQLVILDWDAASDESDADRWYSDDVHLTTTGQARFALWLRDEILGLVEPGWISAGTLEHHVPLVPSRVLDTRSAVGVSSRTKVADGAIEVQIMGEGGVPGTDVDAVAMNLTVVDPTTDRYGGYATVYPCGQRPDTSNINFVTGQTVANSVLAPLTDDGRLCIYVRGSAHLLVDVSGYFPSGTGFATVAPTRMLDTRSGIGGYEGRVVDDVVEFTVAGRGGLPDEGVAAVALNLTVDGTTTGAFPGFATVFPCGDRPDASNINFAAASTVANAVTAPVSSTGTICVYVYGGAHVIADVSGYFPTSAGFIPVDPVRVADTRRTSPVGALDGLGGPLEVQVVDSIEVGDQRIIAASLNVTAVDTSANAYGGYITVYPCGTRPDASNLNFVTGMTVANGVTAPVSRDGRVCIYVYGATDLLVDVNGYITS